MKTIVYDNDISNAGFNLVENAREYFSFNACTTPIPDSDLDSYILSFGNDYQKAFKEVKKILDSAKSFSKSLGGIKQECMTIRNMPKIQDHERRRMISDLIIREICDRGKFYNDNNYQYLFINDTKKLVTISKSEITIRMLLSDMGLNATEDVYRFTIEELEVYGKKHGQTITINRFAYYDKDNFSLYLYNGLDKVYKITSDSIEIVNNGDNGILFVYDSTIKPFDLIEIDENIDYLDNYILSTINFDEEEGYLTPEQQKIMVQMWFYGIFFESIMNTKTILVMIGEKGSGKTFALRMFGRVLFGDFFQVTPLPNKQDDFDTVVTNSYYCVFDNVDTYKDYLNDRLACIATGQTIKKRILYSDNQMGEFETKCFVALTSRTPDFTRDDVADRLICIYLKRFQVFESENSIMQNIMKNRSQIMSYIMIQLQKIIKALKDKKDESFQTSFRIADFAEFCNKTQHLFNLSEPIENIFTAVALNQSAFAAENDPLIEVLKLWLRRSAGVANRTYLNQNREISGRELFKELKVIAQEYAIEDFGFKTPRSMLKRLNNLKQNMKDEIKFKKQTGSGNVAYYKFELLKYDPDPTEGIL